MRHNLYMNCTNNGVKSQGKHLKENRSHYAPKRDKKTPDSIKLRFMPLDKLVNIVLERYADDPKLNDIVRIISNYQLNFTIAKDLNNDKSQKELTKYIRNYLYELLEKGK